MYFIAKQPSNVRMVQGTKRPVTHNTPTYECNSGRCLQRGADPQWRQVAPLIRHFWQVCELLHEYASKIDNSASQKLKLFDCTVVTSLYRPLNFPSCLIRNWYTITCSDVSGGSKHRSGKPTQIYPIKLWSNSHQEVNLGHGFGTGRGIFPSLIEIFKWMAHGHAFFSPSEQKWWPV
jgi:hypothetical protein